MRKQSAQPGRRPDDARGGFVLCGITADGSAFAVRDRHGIRPAWYALDERGLRVASERHALHAANACPLPPGHALIMDADGSLSLVRIMEPAPPVDIKRTLFIA